MSSTAAHEDGWGARVVRELVALSRRLGDLRHGWTILAEGNVSARVDRETLLVKASGEAMSEATSDSFVPVDVAAVVRALDECRDIAEWTGSLHAAAIGPGDGRPSLEAGLHVIALAEGGAQWVAHTHPIAVNSVLCSDRAEAITAGALFPDQVVVCGRRPMFIPYRDPGLALARQFRDALRTHVDRWGEPPKTVYLRNHGLLAMGASAHEVLQVTAMADKAARVLLGALAAGAPSFLDDADADWIDSRPDEEFRRRMLATNRLYT